MGKLFFYFSAWNSGTPRTLPTVPTISLRHRSKPAVLPAVSSPSVGRRYSPVGRILRDNQVKNSFVGAKSQDDMPQE